MSLAPLAHQDVTGRRSLSDMIARYPCGRPPGATTARVGDWFKESPR
jgi:hypothetical protein